MYVGLLSPCSGQVDVLFTFLMIVVSLCHSKMLQLSVDVSENT